MILCELEKEKFHGNNLFDDFVASIKDAGGKRSKQDAGKILNALYSFIV